MNTQIRTNEQLSTEIAFLTTQVAALENRESLLLAAMTPSAEAAEVDVDFRAACTVEGSRLNNLIRKAIHRRALLTQMLATRDQLERIALRLENAREVKSKALAIGADQTLVKAVQAVVDAEQNHFNEIVANLGVMGNLIDKA